MNEVILGNIVIEDEVNAGGLNIPIIKGEKRRPGYSRYSRIEGR